MLSPVRQVLSHLSASSGPCQAERLYHDLLLNEEGVTSCEVFFFFVSNLCIAFSITFFLYLISALHSALLFFLNLTICIARRYHTVG